MRPNLGSVVGSSVSVAQACRTPRGPNFIGWILLAGIVELFRFLFGIEVIEVPKPLVEAVHGGKELIAVAEMVFAELPRGIAQRLKDLSEGRVFLLYSSGRTRNSDRG